MSIRAARRRRKRLAQRRRNGPSYFTQISSDIETHILSFFAGDVTRLLMKTNDKPITFADTAELLILPRVNKNFAAFVRKWRFLLHLPSLRTCHFPNLRHCTFGHGSYLDVRQLMFTHGMLQPGWVMHMNDVGSNSDDPLEYHHSGGGEIVSIDLCRLSIEDDGDDEYLGKVEWNTLSGTVTEFDAHKYRDCYTRLSKFLPRAFLQYKIYENEEIFPLTYEDLLDLLDRDYT